MMQQVSVGPRYAHKCLAVFPLFGNFEPQDYMLAASAIAAGSLRVEEMKQQSVPFLEVTNLGNKRVLFLEGEILVGGGQNRVVNTSVLVGAGTSKIPVSCVEKNRWQYGAGGFKGGESHVPRSTRSVLKQSTGKAASSGRGHRSDQHTVWASVDDTVVFTNAEAPTSSVTNAYESVADRLAGYDSALPYHDGACGVAITEGKNVVAVELFDKPETAREVWPRLVRAAAIDALQREADGNALADAADVSRVLDAAANASWRQTPAAGEGVEHRATFDKEEGSVLSLNGSLVHASLMQMS